MKSKSKLFSISFLLIFLISATGLPLSLHLCQKMNKVSFASCEMCSAEKNEKSCCSDNRADEEMASGQISCCQKKVAAEPLKEKFTGAKEDDYAKIRNILRTDGIVILSNEPAIVHYNDTMASPSYYRDQVLFIINSSFLI
jgi:hypothetical protein